jgi:S-adenosylmethionine decarboxylase
MVEASRVSMAASSISRPVGRALERQQHADRASALETVLAADAVLDHFIERDGMRFAGTHLIIDLWRASNLDKVDVVEAALRRAADAAGATLLKIDLHCFTPNGGITGVAVLAESHISIHSWPERAYAAVDIFMCGDAEPHRAIDVLREAFAPGMLTVAEHKRGVVL